jgi:hypothetical protein
VKRGLGQRVCEPCVESERDNNNDSRSGSGAGTISSEVAAHNTTGIILRKITNLKLPFVKVVKCDVSGSDLRW